MRLGGEGGRNPTVEMRASVSLKSIVSSFDVSGSGWRVTVSLDQRELLFSLSWLREEG